MAFTHVFASLPVAELSRSASWYERFAGRPADLVPNERELAWQFTDNGWIYLILDARHAGTGLCTLLLDDLDDTLAELATRGILSSPVETIGPGVRRATVTDPDGNRVNLGQPPA